ncbi:Multidrug resistance-associated protein 5, partial [Halocaridina rubra]
SAIAISGGSFNWGVINDEEQPWKLKNVDMSVGHGNLVAVVGSVGSGKSSLISAILGELQKNSGRVVVNGNVAYVSQQAWLQNATLRENIIWGEPFDKEKYDRVLEACALKPDLAVLPGGDMTEIGEKVHNQFSKKLIFFYNMQCLLCHCQCPSKVSKSMYSTTLLYWSWGYLLTHNCP